MTQIEFETKAKSLVRTLINYISCNEFSEIAKVAKIDSSWCSDGKTQEEGIKSFEEWIKGQLQLWAEDYGKDYVIDSYNENKFNLGILKNNRSFSEYTPTSYGEDLDFWFELDIKVNEDNNLSLCFNVNI